MSRLPALFFNLLSRTPVEQLTQWRFVLGATFGTYIVFSLMFIIAAVRSRGDIAESTDKGPCRRLRQYRLYGAGAGPAGVRRRRCGSGGADLLLRQHPAFHHGAADDGACRARMARDRRLCSLRQASRSAFCCIPSSSRPLSALRRRRCLSSRPRRLQTLLNYLAGAAAPCALFAMGVTLALRPLKRVPSDMLFIVVIKLDDPSGCGLCVVELARRFSGRPGSIRRCFWRRCRPRRTSSSSRSNMASGSSEHQHRC